MRRYWPFAIMLMLAACSHGASNAPPAESTTTSTPGSQQVKSPDGKVQGEIDGTPAPGSKFARVKIGMSMHEVEDLIGPPNDVASHITGKAFIPFYFGGDTTMTEAFYRGEGQLSFAPSSFGSSATELVRIIVDPNERGYAH